MSASVKNNDDFEDPLLSGACAGSEPPSGFILKLYQMVSGAPDEVITVSFVKSELNYLADPGAS
jgi:hypothetical protein